MFKVKNVFSTEKLYNVDEALLASVEEKHRLLTEEVERLEKDSQTVRLLWWLFCLYTDPILHLG